MLFEKTLAAASDVIHLLAVGLDRANVVLILEELQRRIDSASRWRVAAPHPLLERPDDFIAVTGLFFQKAQNDEFHLAGLEDGRGPRRKRANKSPKSPSTRGLDIDHPASVTSRAAS